MRQKGYWSKEKCHKVALRYKTRTSFSVNDRTCYSISAKRKWLDDICSHMKFIKLPAGYWTYDKCKEAALKCKSSKELYQKFRMAYQTSMKKGWLDDMQAHMEFSGNRFRRIIYAIIFSDMCVYVGLTYNVKRRYKQHLKNKGCSVYNHIEKTGLVPKYIKLTGALEIKDAQASEKYYVQDYKRKGYTILNRAKTGAIGSTFYKWTIEKCRKEALKYMNRYEFNIKSVNAYNASIRHGWINEICTHMIVKKRPVGYWNFNNCRQEAIKCKNKEEFYKKLGGAFVFAKKNGWLNMFFRPRNNNYPHIVTTIPQIISYYNV